MLGIRFSEGEGITVPYPAKGGNHHGFFDFRGDPEAAENVSEATLSAGLRGLLKRLAQPGAPLFSIGCDLGVSNHGKETVAGGYVHVAARDYAAKTEPQYRKFLDGVFWDLRELSGEDHWAIEVSLPSVRFLLDGGDVVAPSVDLNFHAIAETIAGAAESRERLLTAMESSLLGRALQFLGYAI